jgi:hypothetical protein
MWRLRHEWLAKLGVVPKSEWQEFSVSEKGTYYKVIYGKGRWCNLAWYRNPDSNQSPDGSMEQRMELQDGTVICERPDNRKFGYPSSARFALLSGKENSYWTADCGTSVAETEQPDKYAFLLHKTLMQGTAILDIHTSDCKFLLSLQSLGVIQNNQEFFSFLCGGVEKNLVYPITHAISEIAYCSGYKGVLYQSARIRDIKQKGISDFNCLVVFERAVLCD